MSTTSFGTSPAASGELTAGEPMLVHRSLVRSLWRSRNGRAGVILVAIVVGAAISAALGATPYNPQYQNASALLAAPSWSHPFGTRRIRA